MRIFIGTTEIAGSYRSLAMALRRLGHQVHFVAYESNPFAYGGEDRGRLIAMIRALRRQLSAPGSRGLSNLVQRQAARWLLRLSQYCLLAWAAWRCDAFIFGFHESILPKLGDLRLLRLAGRTVWMQSNGSDVRPPYIDATMCRRSRPATATEIHKAAVRCRRRVLHAERWATGSIDIPMQGLQRTKPFINWLKIGVIATPSWYPECYSPPPPSDTVRLLHCPSFPSGKGTAEIRSMVIAIARDLEPRGIKIDYKEVIGRPNKDVLNALLQTDIVLDQLYADYGMAGFAVEAAWFGRPVVVGGYAADVWRRLLPAEELPPTHYVHPDRFSSELRSLVVDAARRVDSGRRHRQFMETTWSPDAVAARYVRLLQNDIPPDWWIKVDDALDGHGWGFPESVLVETVSRYVRSLGTSALCLDHVPDRERKLLALWTQSAARDGEGEVEHGIPYT